MAKQAVDLRIYISEAVRVDVLNDLDFVLRKVSEPDGEAELVRAKPTWKIRRDDVRQMTVLQIQQHEKGFAIAGFHPSNRFVYRKAVVDTACMSRLSHPIRKTCVARRKI